MGQLIKQQLVEAFQVVRSTSMSLAEGLSSEDCQIQSMPDASPIKWHLAHTTWFFETFILRKNIEQYKEINEHYRVLFNSYYHAIGDQFSRPQRGLITRPGLDEIKHYRHYVDEQLIAYLQSEELDNFDITIFELGLQHEKQHQELMLTDLKHAFYQNPTSPIYSVNTYSENVRPSELKWLRFEGGLVNIGAADTPFSFDNERPVHKYFLKPFQIASRTVTNGEYLEFIDSGGYRNSLHWLSDAWSYLQNESVTAPLYWTKKGDGWYQFTLEGMKPLDLNKPVCHVNFYEASAYASWKGKRLPTEYEWEHAASRSNQQTNYLDLNYLEPAVANGDDLVYMFGGVWEWCNSAYLPYPGFTMFGGDAAEYNGKFMSGQFVLRGGSCSSPENHVRASYRNFFYPHQSWQFSGIRLAEDAE